MKLDLSQVEALFFTAMQSGYALEGVKKTKVVDIPGYKEIRYEDGEFLLVDRWCVNPDTNKSAGTTTIFYQEKPVWFMSYGGHYPEYVIPFLKIALRHQYCCEGVFMGGRGPARYSHHPNLIYKNECKGDFGHFRGKEEILTPEILAGEILQGYHEYWGMSLV